MVTSTILGGQCVSISTCTRTSRHLATFTRRPGSSLYTLATEPSQVAASAQVSASGPVAPPSSCRLLSHQTLLWHHRLGHPSLPRLRGMHSCLLVSGLPMSLPPLPPSPAPPCLSCVEGRQLAAPHSSSFPLTTAPLQTLHMDVWGLARVSGQGRERYFLLVVDDSTRYTTVFPLHSKGEVSDLLIPWICTIRLQLRERFRQDLPVLRLHSNRGGEFSSDLLRDFCRGEGILQSFTLPDSPQQNGIAEHRIGLVMEVDPLLGTMPVEVAVEFGAAQGATSGGAELGGEEPGGAGPVGAESEGAGSRGAKLGGVEPRGAKPAGVESGGSVPAGVEPWGAEPWGTASSGVELPELETAAGDTGAGGAGVTAGAGGTRGATSIGPGGARSRGTGAAGSGAGGAVSGDTCAGGTVRMRAYFVPLLQHILGVSSSIGITPPLLCPPPDQSQPPLQPASSLSAPSPYTEQTGGLTERHEPASCPASPVRTVVVFLVHVLLLSPAPTLWQSVLPLFHCVFLYRLLLSPLFLPSLTLSPTVSRLLANFVTDPSFESTAASALLAQLDDLATACRLDYATTLIAVSKSVNPSSKAEFLGGCATN
ncbi:unnamed protein product [Closterium sp. NIES-54]